MGTKRRLKDNKHRGMHRRMLRGRKPMSEEQKAERKKIQEADKERTKADLANKKITEAKKKVVKKE